MTVLIVLAVLCCVGGPLLFGAVAHRMDV